METLTWLSVLPPILVVILAVSTRNIIFSLLMGIVFGLGIYGAAAPPGALEGRNVLDMTIYGLKMMVSAAGTPKNLLLIFFLVVLGGLIAILTAAGCANSFSASAVRMIRGKRSAEGFTFLLGCVIFVDDYFNAITVGNVMVPITDKFKISRAKLAYLIDSTSAILMPVSSWVATVISLSVPELARYGIEVPGMQAFLSATVFNAYAWLTLLMVVAVIVFRADIGPMKRYEDDYARTGVDTSIFVDINESVIDDMGVRQKGTAADMLITIISLVAATFMVMLYTGGFFTEGRGIQDALMYCDPDSSLASAVLIALVICFALLVGRSHHPCPLVELFRASRQQHARHRRVHRGGARRVASGLGAPSRHLRHLRAHLLLHRLFMGRDGHHAAHVDSRVRGGRSVVYVHGPRRGTFRLRLWRPLLAAGGHHGALLRRRGVQAPCPRHDAAALRGDNRRYIHRGVHRCRAYRQRDNFISWRISGDNYPVLYYWKEK